MTYPDTHAARAARPRQHARADVAREPHVAGAARQVGDGSADRHAAAAAAAGRARSRGDDGRRRTAEPLTTRERMEMHRTNPTCKTCHQYMDPIGLALDNFDVTGKWRYRENGMPLDTRGKMYDGTRGHDADGPDAIAAQASRFRWCASFTENLMAYALGRRVEDFDQPDHPGDRPRGGSEGLQDVVVHHGRREQQCVPQQASRSRRRTQDNVTAAVTARGAHHQIHDHVHSRTNAAAHVPSRAGRHDCASVPRRDGAGVPLSAAVGGGGRQDATRLHRVGARRGGMQRLGRVQEPLGAGRRSVATSSSSRRARCRRSSRGGSI